MFKKIVLNLIILFFILILLLLDLEAKKIKILKAVASSVQDNNSEFKPENAIDNDFSTRWSSEFSDPQWICFDLGSKKSFQTVTILWESAYGKVYELQISDNALDWKTIFKENNGDGDEDIIITKRQKARYVRIYCIKRGTQWGYSIREVSISSKKKGLYKEYSGLPAPIKRKGTYLDSDLPIEKRVNDLLKRMSLKEKIDELSGKDFMDGKANKRLGIPPLLMTDGPHGVRDMYGNATCFPTLVTVAATWDITLAKRMGRALGQETRAKGRNLILGPCINIHRTPLGGRNFESFSEDPYLVSKMAVAYVQGVQSEKIGTSTKHFAANNQEWERNSISVEISERALREIYFPGFKAAVQQGKTTTIMGAYNRVNGDYCCENSHLLIDILKKEWGFKGFVVSDWWAIHNGIKAAKQGCDMEMPGPGNYFAKRNMLIAIKTGQIPESIIDDKVRRILYVKFYLGLFDGVEKKYKGAVNTKEHQKLAREIAENSIVLLKNKHNILPLDIKNLKSIAVIGPNARVLPVGGGGSSQVGPPYAITPFEGIKNKCKNKIKIEYAQGCQIPGEINEVPLTIFRPSASSKGSGLKGEYFNNPDLKGIPVFTRIDKKIFFDWKNSSPKNNIKNDNFSVRWTGVLIPPQTGKYEFILLSDDGSRLYINNKLVVNSWWDHGIEIKKNSLELVKGKKYKIRIEYYERGGGAVMKFGYISPDSNLLKNAVKIAKEADTAIIFAGLNKVIEGEGVDRKDIGLPDGQDELIEAISKVNKNTIVVLINGTPVDIRKWVDKVSAIIEAFYPGQEGGKAIANILFGDVNPSGKLPVTFPKKLEDNPSYGNYPGSGGKVHYQEGIFVGYRYYDTKNIEPLFSFGYGLSYTKFQYSDLKISPKKVKSGKSVKVSLYIKNIGKREGKEVVQLYVRDIKSSLERPYKELKGFKKINLKPGERKKIVFKLEKDAFSFYHPDKRKWIVEPGKFEILIGSSSRDIRLKAKFILE